MFPILNRNMIYDIGSVIKNFMKLYYNVYNITVFNGSIMNYKDSFLLTARIIINNIPRKTSVWELWSKLENSDYFFDWSGIVYPLTKTFPIRRIYGWLDATAIIKLNYKYEIESFYMLPETENLCDARICIVKDKIILSFGDKSNFPNIEMKYMEFDIEKLTFSNPSKMLLPFGDLVRKIEKNTVFTSEGYIFYDINDKFIFYGKEGIKRQNIPIFKDIIFSLGSPPIPFKDGFLSVGHAKIKHKNNSLDGFQDVKNKHHTYFYFLYFFYMDKDYNIIAISDLYIPKDGERSSKKILVFPMGLAKQKENIIISYGDGDEDLNLAIYDENTIFKTLTDRNIRDKKILEFKYLLEYKSMYIGILAYKNTNNLGDWYQSVAAIYNWWIFFGKKETFSIFLDNCIKTSTIESYKIIWIDRDRISKTVLPLDAKSVLTIMNGWWLHSESGKKDFPPPSWLKPIFVSFHLADPTILDENTISYFKKYAPIGCRDLSTVEILTRNGIHSYYTGCLTTTLNLRDPLLGLKQKNIYNNKTVSIDCPIKGDVKLFQITKCNTIDYLRIVLQNQYDLSFAKQISTSRLHVWLPQFSNDSPVTLYCKDKIFTEAEKDTYGNVDRFFGIVGKSRETIKREAEILHLNLIIMLK